MSGAINLNDFCSVCRVKKPKYKCPRCRTGTCSVDCVQRHKKIAGCSGKRDPSVFKPTSELATVEGINHDYNYLYGVQDGRRRAARNAESRGVVSDSREMHKQMRRHLKRSRTKIRPMPKGMSRHQANNTKWDHKRGRILWTVEWLFPDGSRHHTRVPDNEPLHEGINAAIKATGFRTREEDAGLKPSNPQAISPSLHAYLWKPMAGTGVIVLIPLREDLSLGNALYRRTVFEFPSIYLLHQDPQSLPNEFRLDNHYSAKFTENTPSNVDHASAEAESAAANDRLLPDATTSEEANCMAFAK